MRPCRLHLVPSLLFLGCGFLLAACSLTSGLDKYDDYTFGGQADAGDGETSDGAGGDAGAAADAGDAAQEDYWERFDRFSHEVSEGCGNVQLYCTGGEKLDTDLKCPERCHAVTDTICFCPFLLKHHEEAKSLCESVEMDLIKIDDEDENNAIGDLLISLGAGDLLEDWGEVGGHFGAAWIGLTDHDKEGVFIWPDGSEATYTAWATGQPDNLTEPDGEQCVVLGLTDEDTPRYVWHDWPCEAHKVRLGGNYVDFGHYFFCEKNNGNNRTSINIGSFNSLDTNPEPCALPGNLYSNVAEPCCTTIAGLPVPYATEPGRCGIKFRDLSGGPCFQLCMPGRTDFISGCEAASMGGGTPAQPPCCTVFGDDHNGYFCGTWDDGWGCHTNPNTWINRCDKPTAYKSDDERLYPLYKCGETVCELEHPEALATHEQCCTDQTSVDNFGAAEEGLCGIRQMVTDGSGICLQTGPGGESDDSCTDHDPFLGTASEGLYAEPGCCSILGFCGALSDGDLDCRMVRDPPHRLCIRKNRDENIGTDPLLLEDYGNCDESVDEIGNGNRYYFCTGPLQWDQARAACEWKENRRLVRVDSAEENGFLHDGFRDEEFWIGAYEGEGDAFDNWHWSDTEKVFFSGYHYQCGEPSAPVWYVFEDSYVNWAGCDTFPESETQPWDDDGVLESCAQIRADGYWSDEDCALEKAYVCEEAIP